MLTTAHDHPSGPTDLLALLIRHRNLVSQLMRQEIIGRYRGSLLGVAWSFVTPVLMLLIYTFVFSIVFQARWGGLEEGGRATFAIVLFAGMIAFSLFSDVIVRAPTLITANANYVKRVVFPLEVLPVVQMGVALFHFAIAMMAWCIAAWAILGGVPWTALLLPVVIAPLVLGTIGLAWFLASLGVFLRDLAQSISLLVTALLFLTPIFYPIEAIPERYRALIRLNPLATSVEQVRDVLIFGRLPSPLELILCWMVALIVVWLGFVWFQKTRKGFADVI